MAATEPLVDTDILDERVEDLLATSPPSETGPSDFLGAQFDRGLAWVQFPVGYGGLGLSSTLQSSVDARLAQAGAPAPSLESFIGRGMVAPTLATHGTASTCDRHLRAIFTGEEIWCQLFSEPGAGSDVASLATRAERTSGTWRVSGQKVWTSIAHLARFGLLIARTDPDAPKHRGMTAFIVDMGAPGVDIRPLHQITGEAEFNEVYLTDVQVDDAQRIGEVGAGWRVALTTLTNERVAIGGDVPPKGSGFIGELVSLWHQSPRRDATLRDAVVRRWIEAEVLRLTNVRALAARAGGQPGPEGSIGKLASGVLNQRITALALELLGPEGMLKPGGYDLGRPPSVERWAGPQQAFLRAVANTIEGGTTEIAKNILAERVLGLPPEDRGQRDVPWRDLRRT